MMNKPGAEPRKATRFEMCAPSQRTYSIDDKLRCGGSLYLPSEAVELHKKNPINNEGDVGRCTNSRRCAVWMRVDHRGIESEFICQDS